MVRRPEPNASRLRPWMSLVLGGSVFGALQASWLMGTSGRSLLPGEALPAVVGIAGWSLLTPLLAAASVGAFALALRWWLGPGPSATSDLLGRLAVPTGWALLVLAEPLARWPLPRGNEGVLALVGLLVAVSLVVSLRRWLGPALTLSSLALLPVRVPQPEALPTSSVTSSAHSVVLITLDTFRADHLGAIGGWPRDVQTPHLDALVASGAVFLHGVSDVPLTLPSHLSMLTGVEPDGLGVVRNGLHLADDTHTVAADMRGAGLTAGAFVSAGVLRAGSGLGRDFDHFDDRFDTAGTVVTAAVPAVLSRAGWIRAARSQRRGDETVSRALTWWSLQDGPVFLWVHLYDPHAPYAPPPPFDDLYDPDAPDAPGLLDRPDRRIDGRPAFLRPRDVRKQVALYDGEVSWTDEVVGRLVDGLPADVSVIVAGDHGESLVEHGYILNHGASLHEPSLHVPIVIRAPGVAPGTRVEAPTSVRGVAATIRALAGLESERSLLDLIDTETGEPLAFEPIQPTHLIRSFAPGQQARPNFGERPTRQVAYRRGQEKWIVALDGEVLHYDLERDPGERDDLSALDPRTAEVREEGTAWLTHLGAVEASVTSDTSTATRDALEALGYTD